MATGRTKPLIAEAGFTLLEVVVVIFIISLLMALTVPAMTLGDNDYLRREAVQFRNVLEWGGEKALYEEVDVTLAIDLQRNRYHLAITGNDPSFAEEIGARALDANKGRMRWGLADSQLAQLQKTIRLTAWGPVEPVVVQFATDDGASGYQVVYTPLQGRPLLMPIGGETQ